MKPSNLDKMIIGMMRRSSRVSRIVEEACGAAYEMGVNSGLVEGAKINGKKYANKVKKALKGQYKA